MINLVQLVYIFSIYMHRFVQRDPNINVSLECSVF